MIKEIKKRADPGYNLEVGAMWCDCGSWRKAELSMISCYESVQLERGNIISQIETPESLQVCAYVHKNAHKLQWVKNKANIWLWQISGAFYKFVIRPIVHIR